MAKARTTPLESLHFRERRRWRAWLDSHHATSPGVWFVFDKAHTGKKSIPYEEMVCEALCFGWVDSLIKRLDDDRYAMKVTPRRPTSKWSAVNRRRWADLEAQGLLSATGLAAAPTDNTYTPKPKVPELPGYLARGSQDASQGMGSLPRLAAPRTPELRRLDPYGKAARDARQAHPRVHRVALGGQETGPENRPGLRAKP